MSPEEFAETFHQVVRVEPLVLPADAVRPAHRVNRHALQDLWDDKDYKALRQQLDRET